MAFFSKVGNILRQASSKRITSDLSRVNSSIFQAIRCMSSSKVFIGGVSFTTDEQSLKEAFARYGEVLEARIIMDRETGRSRGFGFVTYTSSEEASSAIQALDGQELHGRRVKVNYATDRPRSNFGGDGYGGGGGGYGGDSNYGGGAPAYVDNNGASGGFGGGTPGYGNTTAGGSGGYGGGAPGYDNTSFGGSGGYGGGAPGYGNTSTGVSDGYGEPATGSYNSTSSFGGPPNFSSKGGYGGVTEAQFGSGGDQFANNPSSGGVADGSGDFNSTHGNF
ncbi:unnamed protein product [Rhodiola kirilowii]